jgi:uncharacterized protein (TIGR02270 family)
LKSDAVAKGLIPGEGAAFVALTLDASGQSLAKILGIGLGREDASTTVQSGSHPSGYGLEEAIRAALEDARVPESGLHFRVSDLNGESYGAYETMLASSRVYQTRRERFPLRLAAASVGETGAAAGALSIVLAAMAIRLGYAGGTVGICEASSDESYRGACIVGQGDMLSPVRDQSDISRVVSALENPPIRSIAIQHVGQAALLRYGRTRLVRATHVGLLHLGRLDERINAHLDGISASGPYGASQVRAALANPQAGELFVATVCAIEDGQLARLDELIEIAHAIPESWRGVLSGFGWVPSTHLRGITRALLEGARPWQREVGLVACRLHGVDPGRALERALGDTDRELRLCALRTAGRCGRLDLLDACMDGLAADDVRVALEAAHSALLLGDRNESLDKLESLAMMTSETDCLNLAALRVLFKVISPNRARSVLAAVARDPKRMRVLLGGVSVCGDPYYVPWLIAQMWDPKVSRLAGEAFSSIAGIDLALSRLDRASPPDGIAVGPTNSPDDDNVAIDEDDTLPWPDPERINAWWKSNGHRFMAGTSYFMGDLATPAKCLQVLKTGLQRQRTAAAEYLTLFTPGRPVFNTAAPAWRQGRLLATMPE